MTYFVDAQWGQEVSDEVHSLESDLADPVLSSGLKDLTGFLIFRLMSFICSAEADVLTP